MTWVLQLERGADAAAVTRAVAALGGWAQALAGGEGPGVVLVGPGSRRLDRDALSAIGGVADVAGGPSPHPLLDAQAGRPVSLAGGRVRVGPGAAPVLMAGPCAVESPAQIEEAAALAAEAGAALLRGGAFKPRTSPHSFRGHGARALEWMRHAADRHGLLLVTEATSEADAAAVAEVADLVQIGSRNMQAFGLLRVVGATGRPVLLKRGRAATLAEWRLAGEHLLAAGAPAVIFCERGIAGHDPELRNTLDLGGAVVMRHAYGLPVVADPSHAAGRRDAIAPLAAAAIAAGLDGVMVEAHPDAAVALSDGPQALSAAELRAVGRRLGAARDDEEVRAR